MTLQEHTSQNIGKRTSERMTKFFIIGKLSSKDIRNYDTTIKCHYNATQHVVMLLGFQVVIMKVCS